MGNRFKMRKIHFFSVLSIFLLADHGSTEADYSASGARYQAAKYADYIASYAMRIKSLLGGTPFYFQGKAGEAKAEAAGGQDYQAVPTVPRQNNQGQCFCPFCPPWAPFCCCYKKNQCFCPFCPPWAPFCCCAKKNQCFCPFCPPWAPFCCC